MPINKAMQAYTDKMIEIEKAMQIALQCLGKNERHDEAEFAREMMELVVKALPEKDAPSPIALSPDHKIKFLKTVREKLDTYLNEQQCSKPTKEAALITAKAFLFLHFISLGVAESAWSVAEQIDESEALAFLRERKKTAADTSPPVVPRKHEETSELTHQVFNGLLQEMSAVHLAAADREQISTCLLAAYDIATCRELLKFEEARGGVSGSSWAIS